MNPFAFLTRRSRKAAKPANPASELAKLGAAKRKEAQRAESRRFHREMRKQLGLPKIPEWEDA